MKKATDIIKNNLRKIDELISIAEIKLSKLASIASIDELRSENSNQTNYSPFMYGVIGEDGLPGVLIPKNESGVFRGIIKIDQDSAFIAQSIMSTVLVDFQASLGVNVILNPNFGKYFTGTSKTEDTLKFTGGVGGGGFTILNDYGFRITDRGSSRNLTQSVINYGDDGFIPLKTIGTTLNFLNMSGPNSYRELVSEHIFAKNTVIEIDIKNYAKSINDSRVFVSFFGRKVYGN